MSFIDRLLQSRRIVTKVLLFVVPLILLIAGVGLAGYYTSSMLNGHMTVTRATIENIGDFEELQAALQDFTDKPDEATLTALRAGIDRQQEGVAALEGLLATAGDRERVAPVKALAPQMRERADALWAVKERRDQNAREMEVAFDEIRTLATAVDQQIDTVRRQFDGKERFAKAMLFEAFAYKSIAHRIENLRDAVRKAETDEATAKAATLYGGTLLKEFAAIEPMLSPRGKAAMEPIRQAAEKMKATAEENMEPATKSQTLRVGASGFMKWQGELQAEVSKKSGDAAERFVDLEDDVATLRDLLEEIDTSLTVIDAMRLHAERFSSHLTEEARGTVLADIAALRTSSAKVSELNPRNAAMRDFAPKLEPLLKAVDEKSADTLRIAGEWRQARGAATEALTAGMAGLKNFVAQAQEVGKEDSERSARLSVIAMVVGTLLAIAGGLMLVETLRGPLKRVTEVMKRLADGDLEVKIEGRERRDEIGDMVRSVTVFRDAALENVRLEQEAAASRELSAAEAERRAAERARIAAEQRQALTALSEVLGKLADGDLEQGMDENLPADFVEMARTYNQAVEALRATLADVRFTTEEIDGGTGNLAASADDLARRTEQQAAALEQSSRALRHLSDIVRSTAESAKQTSVSVNEAEEFAVRSGEVVARAVDAMGEISRSSNRIATIIGVIDEIAFQTNLLALNAGVEAARAGEAGRGFAVVAQEVRELAQRCAGAAREIKQLISVSSSQVSNGVNLVEETGGALNRIISHVTDIRKLVASISSATGEQATGIKEVTSAVQEVELITQRNAAMVEENNAEIHGLRQRVETLSEKIERFRTGEPRSVTHAQARRYDAA
ncbi:HAMP domain-containing methyl-accepting chemotaxis protein [Rhizobium sp. LC145]|uniref:methyl-accepting chemotaxis protein n=1 Tax=Rhizobium sp. LC145 TaxID=1120688 RepID=UPI00062A0493|nr:HAMP domain-containing methyl-accepting chemotaxis protein [Rhizobium sp. LC145]KKX33907.1 chemotaxis protein [Rhizobium sp. LC145]TKT59985.1 HAMP domain-containing protein [Rhizobiaceae bacterium LC148]